MEETNMKLYDKLYRLSFSRPAGTDAEARAAELLSREICALGYEPVTEPFTFERRTPVCAELCAIGEDGTETIFPVTGVTDSAPTLAEGTISEFHYLKSLDEVSLSRIRGKIVLLHDRLSEDEYVRLREAGVAAYITTSGTVRDTEDTSDLETARFRYNLQDYGAVPAFTIRMTDAVKLLRSRPARIRYRLLLEKEIVHSRNITVLIPGETVPGEILTVGAHYDSVPFSLGSWDNGAGAVEMLALLEYLKNHPPRRSVQVVLFGSEECGLMGSRAFTEAHREELLSTQAMVNVDVGGSILGKEIIFVTAGEDAETWVHSLLKETGYEAVTTRCMMSSDSAVFSDRGIPSISIGQGAPRGGGYMHTRYDNMDLISEDVLQAEARFLTTLVSRLTEAELLPMRRSVPEKLRKDLLSYFGKTVSKYNEIPPSPEYMPPVFHF